MFLHRVDKIADSPPVIDGRSFVWLLCTSGQLQVPVVRQKKIDEVTIFQGDLLIEALPVNLRDCSADAGFTYFKHSYNHLVVVSHEAGTAWTEDKVSYFLLEPDSKISLMVDLLDAGKFSPIFLLRHFRNLLEVMHAETREITPQPRALREVRELQNFLTIYGSGPLTMADLELRCGLTQQQINRRFKHFYLYNSSQLIRASRVRKASQMIRETALSFAEVAAYCGFSSADYMRQCFRKSFNYSPAMLRRAVLKPENARKVYVQGKPGPELLNYPQCLSGYRLPLFDDESQKLTLVNISDQPLDVFWHDGTEERRLWRVDGLSSDVIYASPGQLFILRGSGPVVAFLAEYHEMEAVYDPAEMSSDDQ